MAGRSYPTSEVRGGSQEELSRVRGRGGGQECQAATVQDQVRGATPRPRPGVAGREKQPNVQGVVAARAQEGLEELFHVQGQEGQW